MMALVKQVQAEIIVNDKVELPFAAFIPCDNDGYGELATGSIRLHTLFRQTNDNKGGIHYGAHF